MVECTLENCEALRAFKEKHGEDAPNWILLPPGVSLDDFLKVWEATS